VKYLTAALHRGRVGLKLREEEYTMNRYGPKAAEKVEETMHEFKRGKLKSGQGGKKVSSRKQAIAIGLSKARKAGAKVPAQK
jgi:hypothetical protein